MVAERGCGAIEVEKAAVGAPYDGQVWRSRAAAMAMGSSLEFMFVLWKMKEKALAFVLWKMKGKGELIGRYMGPTQGDDLSG